MTPESNLSSGSAAPPPDTAAAPSGGSAAEPSAAAPSPAESAASSETGAPAEAPRTLEALRERFREQASQAEAPEPQPDQQPEPEKVEEPKPEVEEEEAAPQAEEDPLAEFEQAIPTREQINADHQRAPKAIRELAGDLAEKLTAREAERAELGGDEGVTVARAILPHLLSGDTSAETVNGFMNALTETNLPLAREIGQQFVNLALDDERTGKEFGNQLLEGQFGEGYNAEMLEKLVGAHRAGLVDLDAVQEDEGFGRTPTTRERELQEKLDAAERQVREFQGNRDDTARREEQRLSDAVDDFVSAQAMEEVLPIVTKLGWVPREGEEAGEALKLHGSMFTAYLEMEIKRSPEYDRIKALKEAGNAFRDGKPTTQLRVAIQGLRNKAKAITSKAGRTLAPTYAKSFTSTAHTAQPPTAKSGDAAPTAPPPAAAPPAQPQARSYDEQLEEVRARFRANRQAAETTVGRR